MTLAAFMRVTPVHSSTGRRFKQPDSAPACVTISPQNIEQMIVWVKPVGLHNLNLSCHRTFEMGEKQLSIYTFRQGNKGSLVNHRKLKGTAGCTVLTEKNKREHAVRRLLGRRQGRFGSLDVRTEATKALKRWFVNVEL